MAATFDVWDDITIGPGACDTAPEDCINGDGQFTLITSETFTNSTGCNSIRLVLNYSIASPASGVRQAHVHAIIESNDGDSCDPRWFVVGYQFSSMRRDNCGLLREIIVQPSISDFNSGIDENLALQGSGNFGKISRSQNKLGDEIRIRLLLNETDHCGPGAFNCLTVNSYGDRYNA